MLGRLGPLRTFSPYNITPHWLSVCSGSVRQWRAAGSPVQLGWGPGQVWAAPPPAPFQSRAGVGTRIVWSHWQRSISPDTWRSQNRKASGSTGASARPCRSLSSRCRSGQSDQTEISEKTRKTVRKGGAAMMPWSDWRGRGKRTFWSVLPTFLWTKMLSFWLCVHVKERFYF